jgi:hypothetical protein
MRSSSVEDRPRAHSVWTDELNSPIAKSDPIAKMFVLLLGRQSGAHQTKRIRLAVAVPAMKRGSDYIGPAVIVALVMAAWATFWRRKGD